MVPCTSCTPTRNGRRPRRTALCPLDSLLFACCPRSLSFLPSNRDPASSFLPPMLLVSLYIFIVPRVPWNSRSFLRRSRCSLQVISFYPASLAIHLPFKYIIFSQKPILLNLPTKNKIVVWRYQSAQVRLYAAVREQFFWPVY